MSAKPAHTSPHGMEPYDLKSEHDLGALSPEQQDKLNQFKVNKMFRNWKCDDDVRAFHLETGF